MATGRSGQDQAPSSCCRAAFRIVTARGIRAGACSLFSPGGTENYFRDLAAVWSDGDPTADELARLAEHHGIRLLGDY